MLASAMAKTVPRSYKVFIGVMATIFGLSVFVGPRVASANKSKKKN